MLGSRSFLSGSLFSCFFFVLAPGHSEWSFILAFKQVMLDLYAGRPQVQVMLNLYTGRP